MALSGVVGIVLAVLLAVVHNKPAGKNMRSPCAVLLVFAVLGFLSGLSEEVGEDAIASGKLLRNSPGGGTLETKAVFRLEQEETEYPVSLVIEERAYKISEEQELLLAAEEEIRHTFCGENKSLKQIVTNPVVSEEYQDGAVQAEWIFSGTDLVSEDGDIRWSGLDHDRQKVEALVSLRCGKSKREYSFAFWIVPKEKGRREKLLLEIEKEIAGQDVTEENVVLPTKVGEHRIAWRKAPSTQPAELLGLGVLAAVAVSYASREQRKKETQRRKNRMFLLYPEFVGRLSLLLGAGMTISGALRKMNEMYQAKREQGRSEEAVYEELYHMICEMDNGRSELRAYQEFSERCDLQPYRKLVSMLISGQKKGNRKLMEQLNEEADRVFLERRNMARRLGEEAGTKLLLPMLLLLVVVMGIVMIPAFLSFYGM